MHDDFFEQQQKLAVDAIRNCCLEAWEDVQRDTNLKPLIRKRPLTSVAAAAAGGLVLGYLLTPPSGGRSKHKQREEEESHDGKKGKHRNFLVTLEEELAGAISPTLRTFAATTAGALFSGMHQGYAQGEQPQDPSQVEILQHRIQI